MTATIARNKICFSFLLLFQFSFVLLLCLAADAAFPTFPFSSFPAFISLHFPALLRFS